jgi:hypothetical protein
MIEFFMIIKTYWRWFLLAGIVVVAGILVGMFSHARYAAGEAAGRAEVQAQWDAQAKAAKAAYDAAAAATQARIESDRKAAEEVALELQTQRDAALASGRDLGRRLSDYQARARRCALSASTATPGQPDAPGAPGVDQQVGLSTQIDRAVEDTLAECKSNATDLDGWYDWASRVLH